MMDCIGVFASGFLQVKSAELRGFLVVVGRARKVCAENSADFLRTGCGVPQGDAGAIRR